jgi:hypothetical protein
MGWRVGGVRPAFSFPQRHQVFADFSSLLLPTPPGSVTSIQMLGGDRCTFYLLICVRLETQPTQATFLCWPLPFLTLAVSVAAEATSAG